MKTFIKHLRAIKHSFVIKKCNHRDTSPIACPWTGNTYIMCDGCGSRVDVVIKQ